LQSLGSQSQPVTDLIQSFNGLDEIPVHRSDHSFSSGNREAVRQLGNGKTRIIACQLRQQRQTVVIDKSNTYDPQFSRKLMRGKPSDAFFACITAMVNMAAPITSALGPGSNTQKPFAEFLLSHPATIVNQPKDPTSWQSEIFAVEY
jgi:hypothetical protein